mgnify:CR=1 FL=1
MKIGDLLKQKDPHDKFNLKRFHDAQSFVYDEILMEVHAGKKQTNWIVFMFPQSHLHVKYLKFPCLDVSFRITSLPKRSPGLTTALFIRIQD